MPDPLTIGRICGPGATSTPGDVLTFLASDHRQSFAKMLPAGGPEVTPYGQVVAARSAAVRALAPHASGALRDPAYNAARAVGNRALPGQTGLPVAVEETGYIGQATARANTLPGDWSRAKSSACAPAPSNFWGGLVRRVS